MQFLLRCDIFDKVSQFVINCKVSKWQWCVKRKKLVICLVIQELDLDHVLTTFLRNGALFVPATKAFVPAKPDWVFLTLLLICEQCAPTVWHPLTLSPTVKAYSQPYFSTDLCAHRACVRGLDNHSPFWDATTFFGN